MQNHNLNVAVGLQKIKFEPKEITRHYSGSKVKDKRISEEHLTKLNALAQKIPFCSWFRQRDHDPL